MELTQFKTYFPPSALVAGNIPVSIARGVVGKPVRVLVENVGATLVFLGGSEQDLVTPTGPSSATYRLVAGASRVFVLSPQQVMFASGSGAGAIITVSVSDAIPLSMEKDKVRTVSPDPRAPKDRVHVNPAYPGRSTGS